MSALSLHNVCKSFGAMGVIKGVDLNINRSDLVIAETKQGRGPKVGDVFPARFNPCDALLFDANGLRIY